MARCPAFYRTAELSFALEDYEYLQLGILPYGETLDDISSWFLDFCRVVSSERARVEESQRKNIEQQTKRSNKQWPTPRKRC